MSTYDELMALGEQDLNSGNFAVAKAMFRGAANQDEISNEQAARATQLWAVALRLLGDFEKADETFRIAYTYRHEISKTLLGSILRDWAMNDLEWGHYDDALLRINQAMELHRYNNTEYGASVGFRARITGSLEDYAEADYLLRHSDNKVYELNNLIWWMRAMSPAHRLHKLQRALYLAKITGMRQRAIEARIIALLGDHIYRAIKRLKRR